MGHVYEKLYLYYSCFSWTQGFPYLSPGRGSWEQSKVPWQETSLPTTLGPDKDQGFQVRKAQHFFGGLHIDPLQAHSLTFLQPVSSQGKKNGSPQPS